jgi:hypothetical protein
MKRSHLWKQSGPLGRAAPTGSDSVLNDEVLSLQHQSRKSLVTSERHL